MVNTRGARYRLPPGNFDPDDLVIDISPPSSPVLNRQSHTYTSPPSSHTDPNRFPRHRIRLLQEYGPSICKFRGHDDFMDLEDDQVLVGDVYGYYEVSHWPGFDQQKNKTKKFLAQAKGEEYKESEPSSGKSRDGEDEDPSFAVGQPDQDLDEDMVEGFHSDALTVEVNDDEESVYHHSPVKPSGPTSRSNTPTLGQFTPAKATQQRRKKTINARNFSTRSRTSRSKSGISQKKKKTLAQGARLKLPNDFLTSGLPRTKISKSSYPASTKAPSQTQQTSITSAPSSTNTAVQTFYTSPPPTRPQPQPPTANTATTTAPPPPDSPEKPLSAAQQVLARLDQRFNEDIANGFVSPGSGRRYSKQERLEHAIQGGVGRKPFQFGGGGGFGGVGGAFVEGGAIVTEEDNTNIDPALLANDARQRTGNVERQALSRGRKRGSATFDADANVETVVEGANDEDILTNAPTTKKRKVSKTQSTTTKRSSTSSTRRSSTATTRPSVPQNVPQTVNAQAKPTPSLSSRNIFPRPPDPSIPSPGMWPPYSSTTTSLPEPYRVRVLYRPDAPHILSQQTKIHSAKLSTLVKVLEEAVTFYLLTKEEWRGKMWNEVQSQARRWVLWRMREEEGVWLKMFGELGVRFSLPGDKVKSGHGNGGVDGAVGGTAGGGGLGKTAVGGKAQGQQAPTSTSTSSATNSSRPSRATTSNAPPSAISTTAPSTTQTHPTQTSTTTTIPQLPASTFLTSSSFHTHLRPLLTRHLASLLETIRCQTSLPPPCRSPTGSTKYTRLYESNMRLAAMGWQIDFFERWISRMGRMRVQNVQGHDELRYWTRTYPSMSVVERVDLLEGKKWPLWPGQKKSLDGRPASAAFPNDGRRGHGTGRGGFDSGDGIAAQQNDDSDSSEGTITRSLRKAREEAVASARVQAITRPEFAWWQAMKAQKDGGQGHGQAEHGHGQRGERGQTRSQNVDAAQDQELQVQNQLQLAGLPLVSTVNPDGSTPIDPTLFAMEAEQRLHQLPTLVPPRVVAGHGSRTAGGTMNDTSTNSRISANGPRGEFRMKRMSTRGELHKTPNGTATAVFSSSPVIHATPPHRHDRDVGDEEDSGSEFQPDDSDSESMFFSNSPPMPSPTIGVGRRGLRSTRQTMSRVSYGESGSLMLSDSVIDHEEIEDADADEDENETVVGGSAAYPIEAEVGNPSGAGVEHGHHGRPGFPVCRTPTHQQPAGYPLLDTELSPDSFNRIIAHQGHHLVRSPAPIATEAEKAMPNSYSSATSAQKTRSPMQAYYTGQSGLQSTTYGSVVLQKVGYGFNGFGVNDTHQTTSGFNDTRNTNSNSGSVDNVYNPFVSTKQNTPPIDEMEVNGDFAPITLGKTGDTAMEKKRRSADDGFEGWRKSLFN